jgi:hypothetical protein
MTPPEGIHTIAYTSHEDNTQTASVFHNQVEGTPKVNLTTVINAANTIRDNTNADGTQDGFKTANSHDITPKVRKAPYQVPFSNAASASVVTPRLPDNRSTTNGPNTTDNQETPNQHAAKKTPHVKQGNQTPIPTSL